MGSTLNRQPSQGFAAILALRDAVWRSGSPAPSERWPLRTSTCVEINQCDGCIIGDDVAALAPSAVRNRHRHAIKGRSVDGVEVERRFRASGRKFDFHTTSRRSEASRVEAEAPQ